MLRAFTILLASQLAFIAAQASAEDILLRLRPDAKAPVINRITATRKVLLDAAPTSEGWQKLTLEIPFEGYVPTATLNKSLAIATGTSVHFLPNANSDTLTSVAEGDVYKLIREKDGWTTVRFKKRMTTYFTAQAKATPILPTPKLEPIPEPPTLNLPESPAPKTSTFNPDAEIGQLSVNDLPPENVVWKSAPRTHATTILEPQPQAAKQQTPASPLPGSIMVGLAETQAREAQNTQKTDPEKPLRLLTGILVREIKTDGPTYPIRLKSPEGRLIAYVDFSEIFIRDLKPFLNERVYLRGHLFPVESDNRQLVIKAQELRLAE